MMLDNYLRKISGWLQQNRPDYVAELAPGLTYEQIEERVRDLPFRLPVEVYELYQWHNGEDFNVLFPHFSFMPLEDAVAAFNLYLSIQEPKDLEANAWWHKNWFPIFSDGQEAFAVVGSEQQKDISPVLYFFPEDASTDIFCSSLTNLMKTIVDGYETGAYLVNEQDYLEIDDVKLATILRNNNPELLAETIAQLQRVQQELSHEEFVRITYRLKWFKEPKTVEPLIQLLQLPEPRTVEPLVNELVQIQVRAASILGELNDSKAVLPLIQALQAKHWGIRLSAVESLRQLKALQATSSLVDRLGDNNELVCNAAASALVDVGAVEELIGALQNDVWCIRAKAAEALGYPNVRKSFPLMMTIVVETLSQLLQDPERKVRESAQRSLMRIR